MFQLSAGLRFEHHTYDDSIRVIGYSCQVLGAENRFAVGPNFAKRSLDVLRSCDMEHIISDCRGYSPSLTLSVQVTSQVLTNHVALAIVFRAQVRKEVCSTHRQGYGYSGAHKQKFLRRNHTELASVGHANSRVFRRLLL